jgi:predicted  nucleic acid-binding Zn-ribbon protein
VAQARPEPITVKGKNPMKMRLVSVELYVRASAGELGYRVRFGPGLNVLAAPNTWGKSTLLQSMVYGLGLEGMLSASRRLPLGESMSRVVEVGDTRSPVVESSVTLTIANDRGEYLRARRYAISAQFARTLVQTWRAASEEGLERAPQVDLIVREGRRSLPRARIPQGFSDFLGWQLPTVPDYAGGETLLYLELLFPLFYVEQKFGWSGVAPRIPTYLRIRDPLRRSVEYVLGLSTLERIKARNALREESATLRRQWIQAVMRARESVATRGWRLANVTDEPTPLDRRMQMIVEVEIEEQFVALSSATETWREEARSISEVVPRAGDRTERSQKELRAVEHSIRSVGATLRAAQEEASLARADLDAVEARTAEVEADRRRLMDLRRLRTLGSMLDLAILTQAQCPTCEQELDGRAVATGIANSVEDNVALADAERQTLLDLRATVASRLENAERSVRLAEEQLTESRNRARLLRDELAGPSNAPSYVEVQHQLHLRERLAAGDSVLSTIAAVNDELDELAERYDDVRTHGGTLAVGRESFGRPDSFEL